jgi:hypothetical protein
MPEDRFLHPRLGHSEKVCSLTDLEARVWGMGYILAADDLGIMRCSAVTLQSANDALAAKPRKTIDKCLERLITVGLLHAYEHQGRRYVCQLDWQDWQKVKHPRSTNNPHPPSVLQDRFSYPTKGLYQTYAELERERKDRISRKFPERSDTDSPSRAGVRAGAPETAVAEAIGSRLPANGHRPMSGAEVEKANGEPAGRFLEKFVALYAKHRHGASYHMTPALDWQKVCDLLRTYQPDRLEKLAEIILTTDDDWITKTDRGIGILQARASWADDRLRAWEARQPV